VKFDKFNTTKSKVVVLIVVIVLLAKTVLCFSQYFTKYHSDN